MCCYQKPRSSIFQSVIVGFQFFFLFLLAFHMRYEWPYFMQHIFWNAFYDVFFVFKQFFTPFRLIFYIARSYSFIYYYHVYHTHLHSIIVLCAVWCAQQLINVAVPQCTTKTLIMALILRKMTTKMDHNSTHFGIISEWIRYFSQYMHDFSLWKSIYLYLDECRLIFHWFGFNANIAIWMICSFCIFVFKSFFSNFLPFFNQLVFCAVTKNTFY